MDARETIARAICCGEVACFNEASGTECAALQDWNEGTRCPPLMTARDVLAALRAAGMEVVPREPTEVMIEAAPGRTNQATEESMYHGIWRAMLAAAAKESSDG